MPIRELIRPKTWATGDVLSAADLNVYLRDNLRFLYAQPACHVYGVVNQAIPNGQDTPLVFQGEHFDNAGMHSSLESPERIIIRVPGVYLVAANASWVPETTGRRHLQLRVNGVTPIGADERATAATGGFCRQQAVGLYKFDADDYVEALAGQDVTSGDTLEVDAFWGGGPAVNSPSMFAVRLGAGHELLKTWTAPPTFASGAAITAAQLNAQLRDNVRVLYEPACARALRAADQTIANSTDVAIDYANESFDTNSFHSETTNTTRVTALQAGIYAIVGGLTWELNTAGYRTAGIRRNGSAFVARNGWDTDTLNGEVRHSLLAIDRVSANDYWELVVFQSSGGGLDTQTLRDSSPWLAAVRIGEDTAVTAWTDPRDFPVGLVLTHTDLNTYLRDNLLFLRAPPSCRAEKLGLATIADVTESAINFDSERWDTDGIHDNVTNNPRFTAGKPGIYLFSATLQWATNAVGNRKVDVRLNGDKRLASVWWPAAAADATRQTICALWPMQAGDYLEAIVYHDAGGPLNVSDANDWSPEAVLHRVSG